MNTKKQNSVSENNFFASNLLVLNYFLKKFGNNYSKEIKTIIKLYKKELLHKKAPLEYPVRLEKGKIYIEEIIIHWNERISSEKIINSLNQVRIIDSFSLNFLKKLIKNYYKKLGPELIFKFNFKKPSFECYFLGPIKIKLFLNFLDLLKKAPFLIEYPNSKYNDKRLIIIGLEFFKRKPKKIKISFYRLIKNEKEKKERLKFNIKWCVQGKGLIKKLIKNTSFIKEKECLFNSRAVYIGNNKSLNFIFEKFINKLSVPKPIFNKKIDKIITLNWIGFNFLGYCKLYFVSKQFLVD